MVKGLDEKTKSLITNLRTIGNSDEMIASLLNISPELVKGYRSLSLVKAEDDTDEMIRLYRNGLSTPKIGKKLGWSPLTVQKILKKAIPDEYRSLERIDDETDAKIKKMLADGYSCKEISDLLNVSYMVINQRNVNAKKLRRLNKEQIKEIGYLLCIDNKKISNIASQFNVNISTIYRIKDKIGAAGGYEKWLKTMK